MGTLLKNYKERHEFETEEMTLEEYLQLAKEDPLVYATPQERMVKAIGEPEVIDTKNEPRLSRIFGNKRIKRYKPFSDFYGMEETIEKIVSFFKHASQGLEEKKQILYLLGPVGAAKSSLADRLKQLMEKEPVYAIKGSPIQESPLGLFTSNEDKKLLEDEYDIPERYIPACPSPWLVKRLEEYDGDISQFTVVKRKLSENRSIGIDKTEPSDEANSDISSLVGKIDIRKLAKYSQDDADAYSYSGGLCKANRGILEFVEMFKAPIKTLHPLLTATQEMNYKGTESISAIPFSGIVVSHSNESEWKTFSNDPKNEAFLDRINLIRVPYSLRIKEEKKIYQSLLDNSGLRGAPYAPKTLEMLAEFSVLTRLKEPENSELISKMKVYNGEDIKDTDPKAKSLQEYRENAGISEGMTGSSTRFAFKVLSKTFNYPEDEISANPVHLMYILNNKIKELGLDKEREEEYLNYVKEHLTKEYVKFIGNELQKAYIGNYSEYGQNIFEKYINYAQHWLEDEEFVDSDTGQRY
ncbi:MAG TPA: PrkA family serine protein kinase, partial [Massilibacterium sp.]|nr:PrkA family serine protein kinase [Massilibacterium sp.]